MTGASPPLLDLDLTRAGHGHRGGPAVLGPLRLTLRPGERVALTGPSGIGKTTLLRILAGLHRDWTGRMTGHPRLAMVFQEPTLLPWRRLRDNLTLTTGCPPETADRLLEDTGLGGMQDRWPGTLSLGQRRRLALARAFAAAPDLLLLDEPFVSLDVALADEMMALVSRLVADRGTATVIVTHAPDEAARLADRILRLEGRPARLRPDTDEGTGTPDQNSGAYFQVSASGVTSSRS